jgi:hypothetical protein
VDLVTLGERLSVAEAAARDAQRHALVVRELDRLAEYLIGQSAPEAQDLKVRIQRLIAVIARDRSGVTVYLQVYCHVWTA